MSRSAREAVPPHGTRALVEFYLLDHRTPLGKAIDVAILALNVVFVGVFVLETYPVPPARYGQLVRLEEAIALVFLAEYLLRLYGAPDRFAEFRNPYSLVDLVSILPTLLVLLLPVPLVALNIGFLRVVRVVRVLRFYRYTQDAEFFFGTVTEGTLRVARLVLTILVLLTASAGLFYTAEVAANPRVSTFGDAFYYTVVTLTTVGFGDILPVTAAGRWVTVGSILTAIVVIPRQASRIIRAWTAREKVNVVCPDCGLAYHDPDASHCKACGHVIYHEFDDRE